MASKFFSPFGENTNLLSLPITKPDTPFYFGPETFQGSQIHPMFTDFRGVWRSPKFPDIAAQISQLSIPYAVLDVPLWMLLKLPNCSLTALQALLWLSRKLHPPFRGPSMMHSLWVWDSVRYSDNLMSPYFAATIHHPQSPFPPGPGRTLSFSLVDIMQLYEGALLSLFLIFSNLGGP